MNDIYILMVAALALLAVLDLIVGVSNDAINFLNSAIGSKVLPIKKILIIASIGVFVGALSSSGMMEVARKGIFVPGQFYFEEIMYIFMAVMITDVILLDVFNSLGMPTSTTVSIVFELLGASVTFALIKIINNPNGNLHQIWTYINYETAITIIFGILFSVVIAFTTGAISQFISRLIYTFNYHKRPTYIHAIFGGISITAILYFIIFNGLKSTSFYNNIKHLTENKTGIFIAVSFILWTPISYILSTKFKFNILKLIIAVGTFSLAMAFAGNDLVNFIGVPIAAWNSYQAFTLFNPKHLDPNTYTMKILADKVITSNTLLILAGIIMVLTLWFSKKAREVINTGVNLSRQSEGHEKFKPNSASRSVVRTGIIINQLFVKVAPPKALDFINKRFEKKEESSVYATEMSDIPAFDMVRASINLVVASILIALGTTYKLPLSTTYVTFMVAMGSSLADRAWGRESAVYRIAGVLSIIGGWFLTAFIAFSASSLIAYLLHLGSIFTVVTFLVLIFILLGKNYLNTNNKVKEQDEKIIKEKETIKTITGVIDKSSERILNITQRVHKLYRNITNNLIDQNLENLRKNDKLVKKLNNEIDELRSDVFYFIRSLDEKSAEASKFYIVALEYIQDVVQSVEYISKISFQHVNNNHKKLKKDQIKDLIKTEEKLIRIFENLELFFEHNDFDRLPSILEDSNTLFNKVSESVENQISRIRTTETSAKNSTLYFGIILETKDLLSALTNLTQMYQDFNIEVKSLNK